MSLLDSPLLPFSSGFKDPYDYIGFTWKIQNNPACLKVGGEQPPFPLLYNLTCSKVSGINWDLAIFGGMSFCLLWYHFYQFNFTLRDAQTQEVENYHKNTMPN